MFWGKNMKNMYTCSFNYITVGYKGVYITERCYPGPSFSKLIVANSSSTVAKNRECVNGA